MASRRAVFDTNILISGYLWKGLARRAIEKVRRSEWIHLVSEETVEEVIRVLAYDKFDLNPEEIEPIVRDFTAISEFVEVKSKIDFVKADPADNIFVNLAVDMDVSRARKLPGVKAVITGNDVSICLRPPCSLLLAGFSA